jgi:hypothetical protein
MEINRVRDIEERATAHPVMECSANREEALARWRGDFPPAMKMACRLTLKALSSTPMLRLPPPQQMPRISLLEECSPKTISWLNLRMITMELTAVSRLTVAYPVG